ncbi:MAG TPA: hypothetical protein PK388_09330, partial [Kiritimatiellia bacterium]|nr:hypothetical protein [Kiritimatiellia bacterium]
MPMRLGAAWAENAGFPRSGKTLAGFYVPWKPAFHGVENRRLGLERRLSALENRIGTSISYKNRCFGRSAALQFCHLRPYFVVFQYLSGDLREPLFHVKRFFSPKEAFLCCAGPSVW